jgi:hypothetical protein
MTLVGTSTLKMIKSITGWNINTDSGYSAILYGMYEKLPNTNGSTWQDQAIND